MVEQRGDTLSFTFNQGLILVDNYFYSCMFSLFCFAIIYLMGTYEPDVTRTLEDIRKELLEGVCMCVYVCVCGVGLAFV